MIFPRSKPQSEPKTYFEKFIVSDSPSPHQDVVSSTVSNRKTTEVPRPEPLRQSFEHRQMHFQEILTQTEFLNSTTVSHPIPIK